MGSDHDLIVLMAEHRAFARNHESEKRYEEAAEYWQLVHSNALALATQAANDMRLNYRRHAQAKAQAAANALTTGAEQ